MSGEAGGGHYYPDSEDELEDDWDDEPCEHEHEPECFVESDGRPDQCYHEHCWSCGMCGCPGYCDDYQTYNLRPEETGGAKETGQ